MTPLDLSQMLDPHAWPVATGAVLAGIAAHLAFGAHFLPDDHRGRPGAWFRNEAAHLWVGPVFVVLVCSLWKVFTGRFPDRAPILIAVALAPLSFELCQYRRFGGLLADKISDAWFMAAGGVALVLAFEWSGGWQIAGDMRVIVFVLALTCVVTARGVWVRWREVK